MTAKNTIKQLSVECPTCHATVVWSEEFKYRPFCSKRCKDGDFIGWANEDNKIAGSSNFDDIFSENLDKH